MVVISADLCDCACAFGVIEVEPAAEPEWFCVGAFWAEVEGVCGTIEPKTRYEHLYNATSFRLYCATNTLYLSPKCPNAEPLWLSSRFYLNHAKCTRTIAEVS